MSESDNLLPEASESDETTSDPQIIDPELLWLAFPESIVPGEVAEFRIDLPFASFSHAQIDGVDLSVDEDYSVSEGSTVISLFEQLTATLSAGEHVLQAFFIDPTSEDSDPISEEPVYLTLNRAFNVNASRSGTSGVIKINDVQYLTLEEAIAAAANGDTLLLSGGDFAVENTVSIPAAKALTLDLGGNALISHVDKTSSAMLSVSGEGSFTLKNGRMYAEDIDGDGQTGGALNSSNANLTVEGVEAFNFKKAEKGAVVSIDARIPVKINIHGNNFHHNSAVDQGGAIYIITFHQESSIVFSENIVKGNQVSGKQYSHGGGAAFVCVGTLRISRNTIEGNSASVRTTLYGHYWSHGGGLSITSASNTNKTFHVSLKNNAITKNNVQLFGGGIYFYLNKNYGDTINLESGLFEGNHAEYAGGAIDFSVHDQPTLHLKNVVMSQNKAPRGGAIWACPTARMLSYSTLGGAILGNERFEAGSSTSFTQTGHDIRFEGRDTDIGGILTDNDPSYHRMTIQDRTFLGDRINWYADDPENLYEPGSPILSPEMYTNRDTSFGVYGEMASGNNWYLAHRAEAPLIFINNTAGIRGGAISANSDLTIGEPQDVRLEVKKTWLDAEGAPVTEKSPGIYRCTADSCRRKWRRVPARNGSIVGRK